jgi:hypothetical protein
MTDPEEVDSWQLHVSDAVALANGEPTSAEVLAQFHEELLNPWAHIDGVWGLS